VAPRFRTSLCSSGLRKPLNPFPPIYRCVMTGSCLGSVSASSGADNRYDVCLNTPGLWLDTSSHLPGLTGGSSTTSSLAGYGALCNSNGPYTNFRVIGASLRIELLTANAGDNLLFVVAPWFASPHSSAVEAAQSWGSQRRLVGFGNGGRSMIARSWSIADIAGIAPVEVLTNDDWAGSASSPTPPIPVYAALFYALADGATNTGTITFAVSVSMDVLFEGPQWGDALENARQRRLDVSRGDDCVRVAAAAAVPTVSVLTSSSSSSSAGNAKSRAKGS